MSVGGGDRPAVRGRRFAGEDHHGDEDQGRQQHAAHRRHGAAQAKVAVAQHQRQVDHIGAGQHLGYRPVFQEFFVGEPALLLDQLTLHHRQHTAKTLQCQPGAGPEQVCGGAGAGTGREIRCSVLCGGGGNHGQDYRHAAAGAEGINYPKCFNIDSCLPS